MGTGEITAEEYDDDNDGHATLVNARPSVITLLRPKSATSTIVRTTIRPTF